MNVDISLFTKYIDCGFSLVKCINKIPIEKGWPNKEYDPFYEPEACNHGVVLRKEHLVIDVDPRHYDEGDKPLRRLCKDLGIVIDTFTTETGGGGYHVYLKKPKDIKVKHTMKKYPGLEFKSYGKKVIAAGSLHPDTHKQYTIIHKSPSQLQEAPPELLKLLKARETAKAEPGANIEFKDTKATRKRFIVFAKTAPIAEQGNMGDFQTFKIACQARDLALPEQVAYDLMLEHYNPRCSPPWAREELRIKVRNAYLYNEAPIGAKNAENDFVKIEEGKIKLFWDMNTNGQLKKTLHNIVNFFALPDSPLREAIHYNEFSAQIAFEKPMTWHTNFYFGQTFCDKDAIHLKYWLSSSKFFEVATNIIHEAVLIIAGEKKFHPVREQLLTLKWDGVNRLDKWLIDYCGAKDNEYTRQIGRKTLLGAVSRVFSPGVQFDTVLILEGAQGTGKSSLCRLLSYEKWYADIMIDPHRPADTVAAMREKWIIELSEMEVNTRADVNALKSFISKRTDRVRFAYDRSVMDYPRQSIFIGTINPEFGVGYLKDMTGNRRYWPVETTEIDLPGIEKVRDQLWAEAVAACKDGEEPYISDKRVEKMAIKEVQKRVVQDPWTSTITGWLIKLNRTKQNSLKITTAQVYVEGLGCHIKYFSRRDQMRICEVLRKEGFERKTFRDTDGKLVAGFEKEFGRPGQIGKEADDL